MRKIVISKSTVIFFLINACLLNLPIYDYIGLGKINDILRIAIICVLFACYFIEVAYKKSISINYYILLLICLHSWILFSTVYNNGQVRYAMINLLTIMAYCFMWELCKKRHLEKNLIKAMFFLSEFICYLNFICVLVFPKGMYKTELYWQNWVLGYKNTFGYFLIFSSMIACIYGKLTENRVREILLYIVCFISTLVSDSATATFAFLLLIVLMFLEKHKFALNANLCGYIIIVLNYLVLSGKTQEFFGNLIGVIFNRNLTFSGRTFLWENIIKEILKRPIMGVGIKSNEYNVEVLGFKWALHAHNLFLQELYIGGVIAFILLIVITVIAIKNLIKYNQYDIAKRITIVIFIYFLLGLMESYTQALVWVLFILSKDIDVFLESE